MVKDTPSKNRAASAMPDMVWALSARIHLLTEGPGAGENYAREDPLCPAYPLLHHGAGYSPVLPLPSVLARERTVVLIRI